MNFGTSPIFRGVSKSESVENESQILLFPNDVPAKLSNYNIAILSTINGKPEKYLINHKQKILLKLIKIKYKDAPSTTFINNNVIQIKNIIVAYKYDFMYIIIKILFSSRESFSYLTSCINSFYNKQDDLMIKNNILSLWESNFSDVQTRVKKYTINANHNERMIIQPYYDHLYNSICSLKQKISNYIKDNNFHFTDFSTIDENGELVEDNECKNQFRNCNKIQSTCPIQNIIYKSITIDNTRLELFCWSIVKSNINMPTINKVIPENILNSLNKLNTRLKPVVKTAQEPLKKQKNGTKKITITSKQTTISSFFKKV